MTAVARAGGQLCKMWEYEGQTADAVLFDESSMSKASSPKQGGIPESSPDTLTVLRRSPL